MRNRNYRPWIEFAIMLIVSAIIYLPFIAQFGYYNDDWYSMYAARVAGSQIFHEIYGLDRPGRAYVMIPLYELFQGNPLYYNISAYVFRLLGAILLLWLLRLIWRDRRIETFLIAILFLIYPGFLSMPNGIDFQSHLIALCLAFLSIGMSILAVRGVRSNRSGFYWAVSILTGWAYLSQMEYYLGFEAVRLSLFALLAWRENPAWKSTIVRTIYIWLPFAPISIFYLVWRVFFFESDRPATDLDLQFGGLSAAPLPTIYDWIGHFVQSFLNVTLLAWGVPLYQLAFSLGTSSSIRGITLSIVFASGTLATLYLLERKSPSPDDETVSDSSLYEMLVIGIVWAIAGLIIVVVANRSVIFPAYSRYGMVSAAGAIMALVAGLSFLSEKRIRLALVFFLFFSAVFTHYANGLQHAQISQNMRAFWWQVSWRVPQFVKGSTIIVNYPNSGNREDSFIWGPANHIYYPYEIEPGRVSAGISAILLNQGSVKKILSREEPSYHKRIIVETIRNYRKFVILTQPSVESCAQVVDRSNPVYSSYETDSVMLVGSYSRPELISLDEEPKTPPSFLFGPEPDHSWCYFYQKADLARQRGEWDNVLKIGGQAFGQGLEPKDLIEWMPFLQAYAIRDNVDRLAELAPVISSDPYISQQACQILSNMPDISSSAKDVVTTYYCGG